MIESSEKQVLVEEKFKEWLDEHGIPYWFVQQDVDHFSQALKKYMSKRPDFMILVPHVGFILVDVEYKKPAEKYEQFLIDEYETKQYCNLQNYFNLQVWYVFSSESSHFNSWYWIPASKVLELGKSFTSSKNLKRKYRAVPINRFILVSKSDNLGRLFSEMPKFY